MCWSRGRANFPICRQHRKVRRRDAKLRNAFHWDPSEKSCSSARCTGACGRRPGTSSFRRWSPLAHEWAANPAASPHRAESVPNAEAFNRLSGLWVPPVDKLRFVRPSLLIHGRVAATEMQFKPKDSDSFLPTIYCAGRYVLELRHVLSTEEPGARCLSRSSH